MPTSGASSRRPAWHHRLEARVVIAITILLAFALAAALVTTTGTVTSRSFTRASADLDAGRSAFYRLADDRADFAAAQAALVTELPVFRAHMTDSRLSEDVATLEAMGEAYRQELKADFCIVADRQGRWTIEPGWPSGVEPPDALRAGIADATAGHPHRAIIDAADHLFLTVSQPARFAEEILGTLTVGFALDDAVARGLAEVTHADVNIVAGHRLSASSLTGRNRAALASLTSDDRWSARGVRSEIQRVGDGEYVAGVFALTPGENRQAAGQLILLQDWRPTQQFVDEVRRRLLLAGAAIFALAVGGGVLFSRHLSGPLEELSAAAGEIAGGNWTRRVDVHGGDEISVLAHAFNDMTASLQHWYDEAKRRDDQLRQSQKMEAIGRLAGGVAHDFNNVLTAIHGYGELLLFSLDPGDARREDANEILKASDRAAGLTRQLLTFSRREVVAPRVLAPDVVLRNIEQMLRRLIGESIVFSTVVPDAIWPVRADAGQMDQVIVNLAVNARDAMPQGGSITMELANVVVGGPDGMPHTLLAPGAYVRLSVTDTGTGMDEQTVQRIFEPFFTTKSEGHGTGLGLATVYGIVDQAGGTIDVVTAVGRGTTFHVLLPRSDEPISALEASAAPAAARATRAVETILLVEDDPGVNALIGSVLRHSGYTVLDAEDGEAALEIVRTYDGRIHLLLADVVMPGMNGREVSEHVTAARPGTAVLFMSGYPDDEIVRQGIRTASVHFIQKPFSMDALAEKIRAALAQG